MEAMVIIMMKEIHLNSVVTTWRYFVFCALKNVKGVMQTTNTPRKAGG
jgi:hypothetical protein